MSTKQELNTEFAILDQLQFEAHGSGIVMAVINNRYAKTIISTYGGHLVSYCPKGEVEDVLFLSENEVLGGGKAIRGGTPICWPWFATDKSGFGRPPHGFARNVQWEVLKTSTADDGSTAIQLGLNHTEGSLAVWPHSFQLVLEVVVGKVLTMNLTTTNVGQKAMSISQALHTYFNVSDIEGVSVHGLNGVSYQDKLTNFSISKQQGDIKIQGEIDRIYLDVPETVRLKDTGYGRDILITGQGNKTTVVWNPGPETIKSLADLDNTACQGFICIETANAADDIVLLGEGECHTITAIYQVEKTSLV